MTDMPWAACRYCCAHGHVQWTHTEVDADTATCYHHGRVCADAMVDAGWARVTEADWLEEEPRLIGAT